MAGCGMPVPKNVYDFLVDSHHGLGRPGPVGARGPSCYPEGRAPDSLHPRPGKGRSARCRYRLARSCCGGGVAVSTLAAPPTACLARRLRTELLVTRLAPPAMKPQSYALPLH